MKRKNQVFALLLALCMTLGVLLCCPLTAAAADAYQPGYYISSASNKIVIRSAPLSTSNQVGVLPRNTVVNAVEIVQMEKSWGRITYGEINGWVRLDLCQPLDVNLYIARLPEDATVENTDFAAIPKNETYGEVNGVMLYLGKVNADAAAEEAFSLNANFTALAEAAQKVGLAVGAYFISNAQTAEDGKAQGAYVASTLDGANAVLTLPVCIFYPAGAYSAEEHPTVGEAVTAFAEEIRAKGYHPGVYCDKALSASVSDGTGKNANALWFHDITSEELTEANVTMWEYRLGYENADYYASRYPMSLCLFDYPTLLSRGCAEGQHVPADTWVVEKAATCTEAGKSVLRCTVCRKVIQEQVIEASGHTPESQAAVTATCTVDGHSTQIVCSVCGETLVQPQVWHATGHKWNAGETRTDDNGEEMTVYTCTACGLSLKAETVFLAGDISMDGNVTAEDARLALRAAVGLSNYVAGGVDFAITDVNNDQAITAEDARSILRAAVGLEALGTLTYQLPDGKVTDRVTPEKPADPVVEVGELTEEGAAQLFAAANKVYLDWLSPVNAGPKYDKEDTMDLNGKTYVRITEGDYKSVEELTAACAKYFLPEAYEAFISANYMMVNGNFYGPALTSDAAGAAKIKLSLGEPEGDTCALKLALYAAKDTDTAVSEETATLKWADGAWKFAADFPYQIGFDAAYEK